MNKKYIVSALLLSALLVGCGKPETTLVKDEIVEEINAKKADYFTFGDYTPNSSRNILAIVESKRDIKLTANLNGAIEKIFVKIGDTVSAGQVIARYKLSNDATQISYDNSLVGLQSAKNSANNSVRSSEISLEASRREYEQALLTQSQTIKQSFDGLDSSIASTGATLQEFINWADRLIGVSEVGSFGEFLNFSKIIGSNNSIEKLNAKNNIKSVKLSLSLLKDKKLAYSDLSTNKNALLQISQEQLILIRAMRDVSVKLVSLVSKTPITANFSATEKSGFESQALGYQSTMNASLNSLNSSRESALGIKEQVAGSLLSAENRIKNAEAQLELAQSNAASQVSQANSQVRIAGKSKQDLSVRAPFTGEVTEILVSEFENVSPGTPIIGLISKTENKTKITAQLSKEEYQLFLQNTQNIQAVFPNGQTINLLKDEYSEVINAVTQKTKIVLTPEEGSISAPVGSVITLRIPLQSNDNSLLIPITAVSFEPSGPEVLKILANGLTERQGVLVGQIKGNAVEVLQGLEVEDKVITFRNRIISGETILLPEKKIEPTIIEVEQNKELKFEALEDIENNKQ